MTRRSPRRASALACAAALLAACGDDAAPSKPRGDAAVDAASRPATSSEPFRFTDVSAASGVAFVARTENPPRHIPEAKGGGVALFDQDGDGRLDLVVVGGSTVAREAAGEPGFGLAFYRGLGGCRFEDRTAAVGLAGPFPWLSAPTAFDFDGDGRTDLLLTGPGGFRLLRNLGERFVDATAGLPSAARSRTWATSAAAADFDGDGDVDLFVCRYLDFDFARPPMDGVDGRVCRRRGEPVLCGPRGLPALPDLLLLNRGDGTFDDASATWGLEGAPPAYGLGVLTFDANGDGRQDVFVANDATPNHLWINEGGRFREAAAASGLAWSADGAPEACMGVDAADLNDDGVEDLVVTNFETEPNDVYLSAGRLGWIESSAKVRTAGVDRPHVGWGVGVRDFDGDGRHDVFVANGHVYAGLDDAPAAQPCVLHLRGADGRFARFSGPGAAALDAPRVARAAAFGDLDDDGDADVVVAVVDGPPAILRADVPADRPWCGVVVRGPRGDPIAAGAVVSLLGDGPPRRAVVRPHASFQATNDPRVIFRVPARTTAPPTLEARYGARVVRAIGAWGAYTTVRLDG